VRSLSWPPRQIADESVPPTPTATPPNGPRPTHPPSPPPPPPTTHLVTISFIVVQDPGRINTRSRRRPDGEYWNLVTKGIIDPTRLFGRPCKNLSVDRRSSDHHGKAMVAERPKKDSGAPAMPGGGMAVLDY